MIYYLKIIIVFSEKLKIQLLKDADSIHAPMRNTFDLLIKLHLKCPNTLLQDCNNYCSNYLFAYMTPQVEFLTMSSMF